MTNYQINQEWFKALSALMGKSATPINPTDDISGLGKGTYTYKDVVRDPNPPAPPGTIDVTFEEIKDS